MPDVSTVGVGVATATVGALTAALLPTPMSAVDAAGATVGATAVTVEPGVCAAGIEDVETAAGTTVDAASTDAAGVAVVASGVALAVTAGVAVALAAIEGVDDEDDTTALLWTARIWICGLWAWICVWAG